MESHVAPNASAGRVLRVFVADDDRDLLALVASLLRGEGFFVREATNGADLLALAEKSQADLMITDVQMPGISGLDVLSNMQRHHPGVPVILMTGFATNLLREEAAAKGAAAVLSKPFRSANLLELVARYAPQENENIQRTA
jgi:two-component system response regulator FlrC